MTNLNDTSIIITGGFGVLGVATAFSACRRGARVVLIDHSTQLPRELLKEYPSSAIPLPGVDLSRLSDATTALDGARDRLGSVDALVNIAGGFRWAPLSMSNLATWDELFAINVKTALNACASALPYLRESNAGRIINVGANAALRAGGGMGPYAASKSAIHKLTESLAEELRSDGITVNAVLPSIIDTPANRKDMPTADFSTWVSPEALAEVILFLASKSAQAVTGALVPVTGRAAHTHGA